MGANEPMATVTAYHNDRLDLIARRVYPEIPVSDGMRLLVWGNPDVGLVFELGDELEAPEIDSVQFAQGYQAIQSGRS